MFQRKKEKQVNIRKTKQSFQRLSEQEHRVNALASRVEEGRGKLRKATGSCTQATIHGYPNGGTRLRRPQASIRKSIAYRGDTLRTETSKYQQEKKENSIS